MSAPSEAKIAANRANAQLSTGPTSEAGKAKVSLNAVKTGLTGRTVLLPSDDVAAYQAVVARFADQWTPETEEERVLVQSLADTDWRLQRIPTLEFGIYAMAEHNLANEFTGETDPQVRRGLIQTKIFLTHRRDLMSLHSQESRLRRQREKDEQRLTLMQRQRKTDAARELLHLEQQRAEAERAAHAAANPQPETQTPLRGAGFEFTTSIAGSSAASLRERLLQQMDTDLQKHEDEADAA